MNATIRNDGHRTARLVLIGEAGGRWEAEQGYPFAGPSGTLLKKWWYAVGLKRQDFFLTNVLQRRPPDNKLWKVDPIDVQLGIEQLHATLATLDDPWLIVPVGDAALFALLGDPMRFPADGDRWRLRRTDEGPKIAWPLSILERRGSIYEYIDRRGRRIKAIPSIHPAATYRTPSWEKRCRADWARIATDRHFRELRLPRRTHVVLPQLEEVEDLCADMTLMAKEIGVDIETPRDKIVTPVDWRWTCDGCGGGADARLATGERKFSKKLLRHRAVNGVECGIVTSGPFTKPGKLRKLKAKVEWGEARTTMIGLAPSPELGLVVPTTLAHWGTEERLARAWAAVRRVLESDAEKSLQNGLFDNYYLLMDHGIRMRNFKWDTLALHHALDPAEDHNLAFLASLYTREPFWKNDSKDPDEARRYTTDAHAFATYCSKDATATREIAPVLRALLAQAA